MCKNVGNPFKILFKHVLNVQFDATVLEVLLGIVLLDKYCLTLVELDLQSN